MKRSVYVIASPIGQVKIGIATKPWGRFNNLRVGSPVPLTMAYVAEFGPMAEKIEARVHAILVDFRGKGEWFRVSVEKAKDVILMAAEEFGLQTGDIELKKKERPEPKPPRWKRTMRPLQIFVTDDFLGAVDDWRAEQPDIPRRSEAIRRMVAELVALRPPARRLVEQALKGKR
jgi:Meiotically up-regulated gene 113